MYYSLFSFFFHLSVVGLVCADSSRSYSTVALEVFPAALLMVLIHLYSPFMYICIKFLPLGFFPHYIFDVPPKFPGDIVQFPSRRCKYFLIFVHFVYCVFMRKALIFMHNKTQHCFGNLDLFGGFHHAEERY